MTLNRASRFSRRHARENMKGLMAGSRMLWYILRATSVAIALYTNRDSQKLKFFKELRLFKVYDRSS
ncbi:hypothetical protein KY285_027267 [Solanum tuberosum]|nr:hypothetical protein KY289_027473 [Solanum tuberosum]KAH0666061.1 hypothetical protein KY285_027267 [Solanum tuberosum]